MASVCFVLLISRFSCSVFDHVLQVKDLMEIPSQQSAFSTAKVLKSFGVAVAGVAIISGIYLASKK